MKNVKIRVVVELEVTPNVWVADLLSHAQVLLDTRSTPKKVIGLAEMRPEGG